MLIAAGFDARIQSDVLIATGFNVRIQSNVLSAGSFDGRIRSESSLVSALKVRIRPESRGAHPVGIVEALAGTPPDEPILALAHNSALWPALAERRVDLTLSGHTHYGQLAIPSWGWSMASLFLELAMGVHQRGRSLLHINPGTNFWGIPFRIGTPPEVTVVSLRSSQDGDARIIEVREPC